MVKVISTGDGSHSVVSEKFGESYHSERGAILEGMHVFVDAGFRAVRKPEVAVLEVGFGTGLNAWLTLLEAKKTGQSVYYESIELYPVDFSIWNALNFAERTGGDFEEFALLHRCDWDKDVAISPHFTLRKVKVNLLDCMPSRVFDVAYFDAFSPDRQPELWSEEIFRKIYSQLSDNGLLTTYSSKGLVKERLRAAGFRVERLEGAGGKRHMVRGMK